MSGFKFRLESIRRFYESQRDAKRADLAQAYEALEVVQKQRENIYHQVQQLKETVREQQADGCVDVEWLLQNKRYEHHLMSDNYQLAAQERAVAEEAERRRQELVDADRLLKAMDRLREKHFEEYQIEENRRENKQLDEAGALQFLRAKRT